MHRVIPMKWVSFQQYMQYFFLFTIAVMQRFWNWWINIVND